MNSNDLTKVALKVFSIYIMVNTMLAIPSFFSMHVMFGADEHAKNDPLFLVVALVSVASLLVLALFIWKLASNLSTKINHESSNYKLTESFILSVFGLYLIFDGLTKLSFSSVNFYYNYKTSDANIINDTQIQNIIYLSVYFIQVIIAITLIIKSEGWATLLRKLRVAGTN